MDFDKAELALYEPVEKMPPFSRKTLVLIAPPTIDKQPLINQLIDHKPDMFGTTIPGKTLFASVIKLTGCVSVKVEYSM